MCSRIKPSLSALGVWQPLFSGQQAPAGRRHLFAPSRTRGMGSGRVRGRDTRPENSRKRPPNNFGEKRERGSERHGCQMDIAKFFDFMRLVLLA